MLIRSERSRHFLLVVVATEAIPNSDALGFGGKITLSIVGRILVMKCSLFSLPHRNSIESRAFLACLIAIVLRVASASAQDGAENANNMLENLKRRSAEERWQRIKRLYPVESSMNRHSAAPARLNGTSSSNGLDDAIPPSPVQTPFAPRLSNLPQESSDDWILPSRPSAIDDAEFVPSPEGSQASEANPLETRTIRSATRIAIQDSEIKSEQDAKPVSTSSRNVLTRKISDINPFYDRDRDTDIRDYASEKIKEYEGQFHPTAFEARNFPSVGMNWEASNLFYYPLYFADPALERTGHTHHPLIQPIASIARFGVQFAFLPYQMTINPPCTEVSPLGWYRPGECAPKLHYQVPLNAKAAVVQAASVTGLYFVIP